MEAARIAAWRGHSVTLIERTATLGGAIRVASRAPGWEQYRSVVDWLSADLERSGVEVRLNLEATLDVLKDLRADSYIFATGS